MKIYFKNRALKLVRKRCRLPDGRTARIEVIEHPGAVLIVPFLHKGKVVLLRQFRPAIKKFLYEFPAGTINPGETPLACAHRELIEETGFRAGRMSKLHSIYPVPGYSDEVITIFQAMDLAPCQAAQDSDEIIKAGPISRTQLKKLFTAKKIYDAKTIAALGLIGWV